MSRLLPAFALTLLVVGCVQNPTTMPAPDSLVRICDDQGCSDRPRNSATFDASASDDPEEDRRIAALEAIAAKDPRAAYDAGLRYFRGDGVKQDSYKALQWMRKAAEHGNAAAQLALGRFYLMGVQEMGADPAEAERWLSIAAGRGNKEAAKLLREANEAKRREQNEYQTWRNRNRDLWYGYWARGYSYYGTWGPTGWYYR